MKSREEFGHHGEEDVPCHGFVPTWKGQSGRVYKGVGKNFFPFLDLNVGLEGKEYKPLNFTLPAGTVNMVT